LNTDKVSPLEAAITCPDMLTTASPLSLHVPHQMSVWKMLNTADFHQTRWFDAIPRYFQIRLRPPSKRHNASRSLRRTFTLKNYAESYSNPGRYSPWGWLIPG